MANQVLVFTNKRETDLILLIEVNPDRYVIKPGQTAEVECARRAGDEGMPIVIEAEEDNELRIWELDGDQTVVTIDGRVVDQFEGWEDYSARGTPGKS